MNKYSHEDQPLLPERRLVIRTGLILGMSAVLWGDAPDHTASKRLTTEPSPTPQITSAAAAPVTPDVSGEPTMSARSAIAVGRPRRLAIPVLNFEVDVDSAIHPVPVPYRGTDTYYDPPTNDGVYWAEGCALPASPSEGTTYLFGHSDVAHVVDGAVFDRLPNLVQRDKIELTTTLGRFAYQVTENLSMPYDELAHHTGIGDFGDGSVKSRLVLITCRVPDARIDTIGYNTVICADQTDATLL